MRWLSGSSLAAAAFLLASAPQAVQAQVQTPLSAPDMMVENTPQATAGMVAINEAQAVGPRISPTRSFQANPVSASAFATVAPNSNADVVTVFGPETFINWAPLDTTNSNDLINILPVDTSLTFVGPDSGYTILNRILPTATTASGDPRGIAFSGSVDSRLGSVNGSIGGNIWFYSPGGIVIGAGSTFDVGGLVLTTNDIDTTGGLFGAGGEIRFSGAADSLSSVTIENGATISASNNGSSYVAMVAPRVVQGGTVNVDGSAAYVAAEQAELTINNGLFDITIGVGTTDANGVVHSGTTTGPSSTPVIDSSGNVTDADAQAIYLVAVPKNDALTMLVGGNIGYQAAASAAIVNGNVVLSAGANVSTTGNQTNAGFAFDRSAADSDSNIQMQNAAFGSSLSAFATNGITAATSSVTDFVIANNSVGTQDFTIEARNLININAQGGGTIGANGNVTLRAGTDGTGGTININADQIGFTDAIISGLIAVGDLLVDVGAQGLDDFFTVRNNGGTGIGQDAVAGSINIAISGGGDLVVGGSAQFKAAAQGGKGENQNGSAQGGNINLDISSGTFQVTGTTSFDAAAIDAQRLKIGGNGAGLTGSDSVAGNISLNFSGGAVTTGAMVIGLGATASVGEASGGAQDNDATAGVFDLTITGGSHAIDDLQIDAVADAGISSFDATGAQISGTANAGTANFLIDGGSLTINSDIDANLVTYGIAPAGAADRAALTVQNSGSLIVTGNIDIDARAFNGNDDITSTGGSISIVTDNATVTAGRTFLDTSAKANNLSSFSSPDEGKNFQAGDITLIAQNGGTFTSGLSFFSANANGNDTIVGNGTGGNILILANAGAIGFTNFVSLTANGVGGVGGDNNIPGSLSIGQGGAINLRVEGPSGSMSFSDLTVESNGSVASDGEGGAPPFEGDGGFGFGGNVTFDLLGGTFTANDIIVRSDGSGGRGGDLVTLPMAGSVGIPAGDGGEGQGGDVTFNLNGGNATVTNLTISANGFGGDGADGDVNDGTAGGNAGRGIGGNATFNAQSGTLTVTSTLTVSADGNNQSLAPYGSSGTGGFGYGSDGGGGGDGIGGTATFNLDGSATINANNVLISTTGAGGDGGSTSSTYGALGAVIQAGIAGNGGNGTGGSATFNNNAGTMSFSQLSVTSTGTGGDGGNVFGFSNGADNIAGDGGSGTGGNATININQDDLNNPIYVVDASGVGGDGGNGLDGGNGGSANGGIAAININNATAILDDPTIIANATGGAGGLGTINGTTFNAGDSGDGGDATGGTARLEVTGAGGNIDLGFIIQQSNAVGGQGGTGYGSFSGNAGSGGNGGDASGGRSELIARTGGTINLTSSTFDFTSTGTGGAGGDGGYSYSNTPGDGGDGGFGTGGTALFLAQGGTITGQDVNFTVAGIGGDGGVGGTYLLGAGGSDGVTGTGGTGTGGTAAIEVQEGSPGIISIGNVVASANGTSGSGLTVVAGAGGRIEITDTSTDPAGLINLSSLTANAFDTGVGLATGSAAAPLGGFFVTGNSGAISIVGDLTVNVAGNIEYSFDGDGQMTVGGNATLVSGQNILIDHSNNSTPMNSIDVSGNFAATAQADFISTAGSRINAAGTATVRTGQNATVADIAGVGLVDISAMWDANVTNAAVTGTPVIFIGGAGTVVLGPQMLIQAGHDPVGTPSPAPTPSFDPNYNATIDGNVTSTGRIDINAGGNAIFSTGSNTVSDNGLIVQTGDDIIIQSGASIIAANNPATTPSTANPFPNANNLFLQAGALTPLSATPLTPIASIVAAGDINANNFAVVMTANAIDGLGGTITANSISVDINDAPANGVVQRDDNGLLSAQCVEGNVCLGTLDADNLVYIGQASNNDVIQGIIESGTVAANAILVTTRRDIVMGTTGIATILDASSQLSLQSNEGNIDLADVSASSDTIAINAAGSLLGSASLTSVNDIGITVSGDISAASINAGRELTTVANIGGALEGFYSVPGSMSVESLTVGVGSVNFDAGGDFFFGSIKVPGTDIFLLAPGTISVDSTLGADNISFDGGDILLGDISATTDIDLNSGSGISFGSIAAGNFLNMFAGDILGSLLDAGGLTADASGNIIFTGATSSDFITMTAGGTVSANTVSTAQTGSGIINISADGGIDLNDVSGNDIVLTAANGSVNVSNNVDVTNIIVASGQSVSLVSQQDMAVQANATIGSINLTAAGNLGIQGAQAIGNIVMASTADVLISGLVNAANDLQITAGGLIDIQASTVGSNIQTVSADMDIGPNGNLGQTDLTGDIRIFTDGTTQMVLGGANDPTGVFYLGNDEFSRINSGGDLTVTTVATGIGGFDMTVQDLNVLVADNISGAQSANIGLSNNLNLVSDQSITVIGLVDFSNANADSGLNFAAGQDLFIDAARGIVQMTNANGSFSGSGNLSITAPNIYAMTPQALADITGLGIAAIDIRLANNDGIDLPDGLIRADNVQLFVTNNLLIQNTASGTKFADRRGFNVGSLSITGPSTSVADIVINGVVGGTTGRAAIPATDIAVNFNLISTINGCVILNPVSCTLTSIPVKDVIEEEVTPKKYAADPFATTPMEIKDHADLADDPLIDEPVTGAGNDDLWVDEDEENEEEEEELEPAE